MYVCMYIYSLDYQYFHIVSNYHSGSTGHICRVCCQKQKVRLVIAMIKLCRRIH